MSKTTSRRAVLAGAVTLPALSLPALASPSSLTADLERLVGGYYEAHSRWSPLMLAAHAKVDADFPPVGSTERAAMSNEDHRLESRASSAALFENGCDAVETELSAFHEAIEAIEGDLLETSTRTIDDLLAEAPSRCFGVPRCVLGTTSHGRSGSTRPLSSGCGNPPAAPTSSRELRPACHH